jgi:hypothetical protein
VRKRGKEREERKGTQVKTSEGKEMKVKCEKTKKKKKRKRETNSKGEERKRYVTLHIRRYGLAPVWR